MGLKATKKIANQQFSWRVVHQRTIFERYLKFHHVNKVEYDCFTEVSMLRYIWKPNNCFGNAVYRYLALLSMVNKLPEFLYDRFSKRPGRFGRVCRPHSTHQTTGTLKGFLSAKLFTVFSTYYFLATQFQYTWYGSISSALQMRPPSSSRASARETLGRQQGWEAINLALVLSTLVNDVNHERTKD